MKYILKYIEILLYCEMFKHICDITILFEFYFLFIKEYWKKYQRLY